MTLRPETADFESVTRTLTELRELVERTEEHIRIAGDRFTELRRDVDQLAKDCGVEFRNLTKRIDEIRPERPACPHCGRAVQKDWKACRICGKPL